MQNNSGTVRESYCKSERLKYFKTSELQYIVYILYLRYRCRYKFHCNINRQAMLLITILCKYLFLFILQIEPNRKPAVLFLEPFLRFMRQQITEKLKQINIKCTV